MLRAPAGFGKTLTAAHIIQRALDKRKRVAFTVPALSLIDQTVAAFEDEGIDAIGVLQGIHPRTDRDQPLQVCSVQTLARRRRLDVDLILIDEAHQHHREIYRWMADCPDTPFIGLSATPWARGLGKYYDELIIAATTADLIRDGFLADFRAFAPSEPDLAGVRTVAGDFDEGELGEAMDRTFITADIIETWLKRAENRPTFVFCVNRRHARHVAERFLEVGAAAEYLDGQTSREDREAAFRRFRSGVTLVLVNVGVLSTGVDLDVRCIVDAKPTKSRILFVQTIGRGLRTAPGKTDCLILDHAGNHLRLGTGPRHRPEPSSTTAKRAPPSAGSASRPNRSRSVARPVRRSCRSARRPAPPAARRCSPCRWWKRSTATWSNSGAARAASARRPSGSGGGSSPSCSGMAEERGYAPGWAAHQFKEKFAHWPNGYDRVAMEPSVTVRNWVRSRQIAFAKARGPPARSHSH